MPINIYCYECGAPLTVSLSEDDETGEIIIDFWCEEGCENDYDFRILTGLKDKDIKELYEGGQPIRK
jgi:hypothetical protein